MRRSLPPMSMRSPACSCFVTRMARVNMVSRAPATGPATIWPGGVHMAYLYGCQTAPSYSGLVRRPLTAVTRVRIPLGSPARNARLRPGFSLGGICSSRRQIRGLAQHPRQMHGVACERRGGVGDLLGSHAELAEVDGLHRLAV